MYVVDQRYMSSFKKVIQEEKKKGKENYWRIQKRSNIIKIN